MVRSHRGDTAAAAFLMEDGGPIDRRPGAGALVGAMIEKRHETVTVLFKSSVDQCRLAPDQFAWHGIDRGAVQMHVEEKLCHIGLENSATVLLICRLRKGNAAGVLLCLCTPTYWSSHPHSRMTPGCGESSLSCT